MVIAASYAHLYVPVVLKDLKAAMAEIREQQQQIIKESKRYQGSNTEAGLVYQVVKNEILMMEHKYQELELLLQLSDTAYSNAAHENVEYVRAKRQILLGIASLIGGLIGGLGGSTIMGLMGGPDLSNIESAIQGNRDKIDLVINMVDEVNTGVTKNHHDIQTLQQVALKISSILRNNRIDRRVGLAGQAASASFNKFMNMLNIVYDGLAAATNSHRLHPKLLEFSALNRTFNGLVKSCRQAGYDVFTEDPRHAFQMEASYLNLTNKNSTGFAVVVHMPIALPDNVFKLYRFQELPIQLEDLTLLIRPEQNYIAISSDKKYFRSFTDAELASCDRFHSIRMCHHIQTARSMSDPDCIANLFNNHDEAALASCKIYIHKPKDTAIERGHNNFMVYTTKPTKAKVACLNGTYYEIPLNGFNELQLLNGCQATTNNLKMYSTQRAPSARSTPTFAWHFPVVKALGKMSPDQLTKMVQNTEVRIGQDPTDIRHFQALVDKYKDIKDHEGPITSHWVTQGLSISTAAVVVLLILVILACVWRRYKRNRQLERGHDALGALRMQDLIAREAMRDARDAQATSLLAPAPPPTPGLAGPVYGFLPGAVPPALPPNHPVYINVPGPSGLVKKKTKKRNRKSKLDAMSSDEDRAVENEYSEPTTPNK